MAKRGALAAADEDARPRIPGRIRLLIGDHMGYLKMIEAPSWSKLAHAQVVHRWNEPSKERGYTRLAVAQPSASFDVIDDDIIVACARVNGTIDLVSYPDCDRVQQTIPRVNTDGVTREAAAVVGVGVIWVGSSPQIIALTRSGVLRVFTRRREEEKEQRRQRKEKDGDGDGDDDDESTPFRPFETAVTVNIGCDQCECMATTVSTEGTTGLGAVGGQGIEVRVYDTTTGALVFKANAS